jgi:hypothetical protein
MASLRKLFPFKILDLPLVDIKVAANPESLANVRWSATV